MINAVGNRMTREIARQSDLRAQIEATQISIATGKRIDRASSAPAAAARVATISRGQSDDGVWAENLGLGASLAAQAGGVLTTASERLARAQELIVQAGSGVLSPENRATIATELRSLADEFESFAQTRSSLGTPLFGSSPPPAIRFSEASAFAPVPGRADIFSRDGTAISDRIRSAATAVASGDSGAIGTALTATQASIGHIADAAATIGTRAARIDGLREQIANRAIEFAAERSGLEDTDLSIAIANLNAQTLTLDAAQAAFVRINRRTLFDILG